MGTSKHHRDAIKLRLRRIGRVLDVSVEDAYDTQANVYQ